MLFTILAMTIDINSIEFLTSVMMKVSSNLHLQLNIPAYGLILAQQFPTTDVLGNIHNGWNDFLESGKAGTFAIGLVLGYVVRGITR